MGLKSEFNFAVVLIIISTAAKQSYSARVFTIVNECETPLWPALTPAGNFNGGGFPLQPSQSVVFTAPTGWSGRIWARTGCNFDRTGTGSCETGSCGSLLKCGSSGEPPATLAEFTLSNPNFYDVSLVDGFNVPVTIRAVGGTGRCGQAGCAGDLRVDCPNELAKKVGSRVVACRSACEVFDTDEYCCRGLFGNPDTCQSTFYSRKFKAVCPTAYSYAYDDPTSIFTCSEADYVVTFCARNQTVCTYHDNKLTCSGSNKSVILITKWLISLLVIFVSIILLFGH